MAMTREEASIYASEQFAELLTDAGLTADHTGGMKAPIDQSLRLLGLPLAGPVESADEYRFTTVLDWAILSRIERAMAIRVDITVDGPSQSKRYSQAVAQVRALKEDAWKRAEPLLAGEVEDTDWDVGFIHINNIVARPHGGIV